MHQILKSISYILHPLIMPILGVTYYFYITPAFAPKEIVYPKLISLAILTIILPLLVYFLLKTIGRAQSIHLNTTKERILPLGINSIIIFIILKRIFIPSEYIELYFFFIGILISTLICLFLAFFNFKASIHMIGIMGLFTFFICLSSHFGININIFLAVMSILIGALATSRLHLEAHNFKEIIMGSIVGIFPQLLLGLYW